MIVEYLMCDKCGEIDNRALAVKHIHVAWVRERFTDAAGSMDTGETDYHLCLSCLEALALAACEAVGGKSKLPGEILDDFLLGGL